MLDRNASVKTELAPPGATPTLDTLPRRLADFATLGEALDYAAHGRRGLNFHDARGTLTQRLQLFASCARTRWPMPAASSRSGSSPATASRWSPRPAPNSPPASSARSMPARGRCRCRCRPASAGAKPISTSSAVQLKSCDPALFIHPPSSRNSAATRPTRPASPRATGNRWRRSKPRRRASGGRLRRHRLSAIFERLDPLPARRRGHPPRAARQSARARHRPRSRRDRPVISWLPWYHDMGLVGCLLSPVAMQMSVDYLKTEDFARRPLAWLDMITRNPGTSVSYSPTFGYDICSRRMSSQTRAEDRFDLSRWRIAGNGADMIRPDVMQAFVDGFASAGFEASAFCPSYGLAEATLAVSLMPPGEGIRLELVEENELSGGAPAAADRPRRYRAVVNCGKPIAGMEIDIRDGSGEILPDRGIGKVFVRGASVMHSYFRDEESTARLPQRRRLARHRRHGLFVGRLHLHRRPRQGHDHHQRPQPLAAGHRVGGRAAARLQVGRHRRLRDHRTKRRGNAGGAGPLPRVRPAGTRPLARRHSRARSRDHRNQPGCRADPAAHACRAPARASCRGPRRATSTFPAKSSLTILRLKRPASWGDC